MRTCPCCKEQKPIEEFSFKNKTKGTHVAYCKVCNRKYQQQHYATHTLDYKRKSAGWKRGWRLTIRSKILAYLLTNPCVDCGESDPRVLEFDHVRGEKITEVGNLISDAVSWKRIEVEIAKCDVRCAICHKRRTCSQFSWYKLPVVAPSSIG